MGRETRVIVEEIHSPTTPAYTLFPVYGAYKEMVATELAGLIEDQLDWESDRWEWSKWSIRRNISHVASHLFRWYLLRWGDQLFPTGIPFKDEVYYLASLHHRRLDEERWWAMNLIMRKLEQALDLMQGILARETVISINEKTITIDSPATYARIAHNYPGTLMQDPNDPNTCIMTLEGTLHHSEGELVTHLYNVQRLKRAQGLQAAVKLPRIGYWTLPDWDRSEP